MTTERRALVRARALSGFADLVESCGGNVSALLKRARIAPNVLDRPEDTLPLERLANLLHVAATTLGVPDFGLQLARHQDISVLGAVALIARHANTVGDALHGVSGSLSYHTPAIRIELADDAYPGYTQLRLDLDLDPGEPRRQVVELSLAVTLGFLRLVTANFGTDWHVGFRHRKGLSLARYRKAFGCPARFGEDADKVVFPTRLLIIPIDPRGHELQATAERYVHSLIRRFPLDIGQQVEALLESQLAADGCGIERIASQLGMHKRTLQRRLEAHGLLFEGILDRLRRTRAEQLLPHSAIPLTQVGQLLGYKEQSSFNRACRRWHGRTPQAVRDQMQRGGRRKTISDSSTT